MSPERRSCAVLALLLLVLLLGAASACTSDAPARRPTPGGGGTAGTGGSGEPAGSGGVGGGGTGGEGGSSGSGAGGSGGTTTPADGPAGRQDAAAPSPIDAALPPGDGGQGNAGYGGVGEKPSIPVQYTATPVPPLVMPQCPEDPLQGFTEYQDSFVIQRPYDLPAAARFQYQDGIYTFFVNSSDRAHEPGNGTAPRTEARYPNFSSGEHLWSADVLLDSPLSKTCIMQIHNVEATIAVYLRVVDGRMFNLSTGKTILPSSYGTWFNLKVAFDTRTRQVRTYLNNCLKETSTAPGGSTPNWYFKHGVYTCDSGTCRDHYKNIHLYQKN
jgi:hypothetical protein